MQQVIQRIDDQIHDLAHRVPLGRRPQDRQFQIGSFGHAPDGQRFAEIRILFGQPEILAGRVEQTPYSQRRIDRKAEKILDCGFGAALQDTVHHLAGQRQVRPGIDDQIHRARSVPRIVARRGELGQGGDHPTIKTLVEGMNAAVLCLERVVDANAVLHHRFRRAARQNHAQGQRNDKGQGTQRIS